MSLTIEEILNKYQYLSNKRMLYGTAGFRDEWFTLHSLFIKMGFIATLRSKSNNLVVGIMITASHNAEKDNGIKMVDFDGGMLEQSWEPLAEEIVNYHNTNDVIEFLNKLSIQLNCNDKSLPSAVIIGRDTRPHSKELFDCVCLGVSAIGGTVLDIGEVTTPQLHFIVQKFNENNKNRDINIFQSLINSFNPQSAVQEYYTTLINGYLELQQSTNNPAITNIIVDGAYGVGGLSIKALEDTLNNIILNQVDKLTLIPLNVELRNKVGEGPVNFGCGAEVVQKGQIPPQNVTPNDANKLICSYDGDADRIVFHTFLSEDPSSFTLLDGDKIAALISNFLHIEIQASGLFESKQFRMGVVQTAYANGGSTYFLKSRGFEVAIAKTGVKYLHHLAQSYDIGVYFEANGHGTIIFSENFLQEVNSYVPTDPDSTWDNEKIQQHLRKNLAFHRLKAVLQLINQAVGDAISDMLMCIISLQILGWNLQNWIEMYTELYSRQTKVPSTNKGMIKCSEDETTVIHPKELQDDLNAYMAAIPFGRCFVRPSGTEDYIRIYAEAKTQEDADKLALLCIQAISAHVGITGETPQHF